MMSFWFVDDCLSLSDTQPASQTDFQSFMHLFLALLSHNYVCDGLLVRSPTRRRKTTKEWKKSITNRHTIYDWMISIVGAWFLCTLYSWTFNCAKSHKALNISNKHCRCVKTTNSTEKNIECHFVIWNSNKKEQSKSSTKSMLHNSMDDLKFTHGWERLQLLLTNSGRELRNLKHLNQKRKN